MYKMSCVTLGPVATNCYTIINEETNEAILIDASGSATALLRAVQEADAKVVAVLLTHGHFDHIDGVKGIKEAFPDAVVYIGENDKKLAEDAGLNLSWSFTGVPMTVKADKTVADGEKIEIMGILIECLEVPGHTVGGMCYYMPQFDSVFDGDTLFAGSVGRSDFPTGDADALIEGIKEKLFTLPDETRVYPGHNYETTIAQEKKTNYYFR